MGDKGMGRPQWPTCCWWWWWPTWRRRRLRHTLQNLRKPISTLRFAAYERRRCRRRRCAVAPFLPLGWHVFSPQPVSVTLALALSLWWSFCVDCLGVPRGLQRCAAGRAKLECFYKSNCIVLVAFAAVVVAAACTLLFTQITSCWQLQQLRRRQGQPLCRQALAKFYCTQLCLTHSYTRDVENTYTDTRL